MGAHVGLTPRRHQSGEIDYDSGISKSGDTMLRTMLYEAAPPDLLKAVNEASGKAFALWITFLTVGTYLAIAIGTTTHLQLLLARAVKLPLLGVDMPLFAFCGFAPPMT